MGRNPTAGPLRIPSCNAMLGKMLQTRLVREGAGTTLALSSCMRLVLLLLALSAFGADAPLTPAQQQELDQYRKKLWDEGCSDQEIEEATERRKAEILGGKPPAPDLKALKAKIDEMVEVVEGFPKEILTPEARDQIRGRLLAGWKNPRLSDEDRPEYVRAKPTQVMLEVLESWARSQMLRDPDRSRLFQGKKRQMQQKCAELSKARLPGEEAAEALRKTFDRMPDAIFDLAAIQDTFTFRPQEGDEGEWEPPEEEAPPAELSEEEIDEIADELMLELMMEGMGR